MSDLELFLRLQRRLLNKRAEVAALWAYHDGTQPLTYIAKILMEQGDRFPPLRLPWPSLVATAVEERLDIEGWRLNGSDSGDDELWQVWQDNDLDEQSSEAHLTALVAREAYAMVGPGDAESPLITIEYPDQIVVEIDPRTRQVVAALKVWRSDEEIAQDDMAILLRRGPRGVRIIDFELSRPVGGKTLTWMPTGETSQLSPLVPVVPILNRPRRGYGMSELTEIIPLVDGANQVATNMLAAIEHHSLHRKYVVGASEDDFVDKDGNAVPAWKIATGAVWALSRESPDEKIEVGQFAASDLRNFHETIRCLAQQAAAAYGLPGDYLGYTSDNPASAEAIDASEARLVKRCERRQRTFGGAWERVMRLALAVMGRDPATATRLETVWRNPATPTEAAIMDAATKGLQSGLLDAEEGREMIGMSVERRRRMRERGLSGFAQQVQAVRQLEVSPVDQP